MKETQAEGIKQGKYGEEKHPQDPRSDEKVFYALLFSHDPFALGDNKKEYSTFDVRRSMFDVHSFYCSGRAQFHTRVQLLGPSS
jgi:hypothetical protein